MRFPRVLVLGATGRIGGILRQVWPRLGARGEILWQTRQEREEPGWIRVDPLQEPEELALAAEGRDVILCLSGVVAPRATQEADPAAALEQNSTLAEAAIRAAAGTGARVILTSSAAVYGGGSGPMTEKAVPAPATPYGMSKLEMERRGVRLAAELGVPVTSLRIGNIAGVDAILGGWQPGFRLDRFPDGRTPRRSYIGLVTLARVLAELTTVPGLPPVLNIATPGTVEMGALLDAAGLDWTPRAPDDTALAEVCLSVDRLERLVTLPDGAGRPDRLVEEWRSLAPDTETER